MSGSLAQERPRNTEQGTEQAWSDQGGAGSGQRAQSYGLNSAARDRLVTDGAAPMGGTGSCPSTGWEPQRGSVAVATSSGHREERTQFWCLTN